MSIEERRREEKEERRRSIVEAAETVLAQKGREAMTMSDIAEEARLSRSLLYVYFEDMDDIVLALTLRALRSLRQQFESAVAARKTGVQQIRAIGEAYVEFAREKPTYFDLVAQFESRPPEQAEPTVRMQRCIAEAERVMEVMTEAVHRGTQDGTIRSSLEPTQTAVTLWGCTHGLIQLAENKSGGLDARYDLVPETLVSGGLDFLGAALENRETPDP